ncbi:PilZ domain-containing protein [Sphingorhabdus sp. Alg239-R122]|uniref:PilZ domain-containing protein n=1 Tax=Sphingorhabdus sp. Alg239-R122 TaxID=2305989 RepID=UPI0013D97B40|nr:PilZ domain-containing protein [Sphingorhabdus sp. Alg239-R122]
MKQGANLSVVDQRRAARHAINHSAIAEHRLLGDIKTHIVNISDNGFMTEGDMPIGKGERITVRLPILGQIEAHMIWTVGGRCGFQFERVIRLNEFLDMVEVLNPVTRVRLAR